MVQATVAAHISTICAGALRHYDEISAAPATALTGLGNALDETFQATTAPSTARGDGGGCVGPSTKGVRACVGLDNGNGCGGRGGGGDGGGGGGGGGGGCGGGRGHGDVGDIDGGGGGGGDGGDGACTVPMGLAPKNGESSSDAAGGQGLSSGRQPGNAEKREEEEKEVEEDGDEHWWTDDEDIGKENELTDAIESDARGTGGGWMRRRRRVMPFLRLLVRSQVGRCSSAIRGLAGTVFVTRDSKTRDVKVCASWFPRLSLAKSLSEGCRCKLMCVCVTVIDMLFRRRNVCVGGRAAHVLGPASVGGGTKRSRGSASRASRRVFKNSCVAVIILYE